MRALQVHGFDGLDQWRMAEMPDPVPGPQDVLVQVEATAISFVDLLMARGGYQVRPTLPVVPGTEFAGTVVARGPQARADLTPGQRVTGTSFGGAWAQRLCVPGDAVQPLADGDDPRPASALAVTYATALYALVRRGHLLRGETVLVLGATGGVGLASMQVARALGARVIAGVRGPDKAAIALAHGADHTVDTSAATWRDALKPLAPQGVDLVLDPVGGSLLEPAFRSLRWNGRHLVVGFAEGSIPSLRANLPLLKGGALIGVDIRQFREREPQAAQDNLLETVRLFSSGALRPVVSGVMPATAWREAIDAASSRSTVGRVVMDWTAVDG